MALGAKEASASFILSSSFPKFHSLNKSLSSIRFNIISAASLRFTLYNNHVVVPLLSSSPKTKPPGFQFHSAAVNVQEVEEEEEVEKSEKTDNRRKLFVLNLPWSFSVADIKKLFGECGGVDDVEIIKQKDGKNRGFAFVTMASGEEAQAAILKYDSSELNGRIIRVEFAKKFKKPIKSSTVESSIRGGETRHKLYVSNLGWKVRSTNLREFFSSNFNPVSVRVVFDSPSGKSAGYGFVSFETKEEADSAISLLDGKELFGRPIRLKSSENNGIATSETKEGESGEKNVITTYENKEEESSEKNMIDNSESKEEESSEKTSSDRKEEE